MRRDEFKCYKHILHRNAGEVPKRSEGGGGAPRLRRLKETLDEVVSWAAPSEFRVFKENTPPTSPAKAGEEMFS